MPAMPWVLPAIVALLAGCLGPPLGTIVADGGEPEPLPGLDAGPEGSDAGGTLRRIVALELSPRTLALKLGGVSGLTAMATFSDGSTADVTGSVQWSVQPEGIVQVEVFPGDNLARLETLAEGTAHIVAQTGQVLSGPCTVTVAATAPAEVRALWVTRFAYNTPQHVTSIIHKAADAGFNVVYFQITGNGDAYYASDKVPWAQKLTGTLGKDPGWDPLGLALETAHARGMQLHAYWNVFSAWPVPAGCSTSGGCACSPDPTAADACVLPPPSPGGQPTHFLRAHPSSMAVSTGGKSTDTEYYWFSPGNPAVRAHLLEVVDELLTRYAVDGLHLDRVRYPGSTWSHDAASLAAYEAIPSAQRPTWADWQRQQVSDTVAGIYQKLQQHRPAAVLSAAVWGIYKPLAGCSTSQGYGGYYQDSIGWMKAGVIDAIVPMIYWDLDTGCTDFGKLLDTFLAGSNGRHVVAGMLALDQGTPKMDRISARIDYARRVGAAGHAVFASTYLDAKTSGSPTWPEVWSAFRGEDGPYAKDAEVPPITWR
jgi:uncharacterized lipoprotein YddW (UPF0748 family)